MNACMALLFQAWQQEEIKEHETHCQHLVWRRHIFNFFEIYILELNVPTKYSIYFKSFYLNIIFFFFFFFFLCQNSKKEEIVDMP